jgi:hypothetical protein
MARIQPSHREAAAQNRQRKGLTLRKLLLGVAASASSLIHATAYANTDWFQVQPVFSLGQSNGGDTLFTAVYTSGERQKFKAGGGNFVSAGALARMTKRPFDVSLTIGYHLDKDQASNGEITFSRVPIELIGYLRALPNLRVGLGVRSAQQIKLSAVVPGVDYGDIKFSSSPSPILEGDWFFTKRWSLGIRHVQEKVRTTYFGQTDTANADHWAIFTRVSF